MQRPPPFLYLLTPPSISKVHVSHGILYLSIENRQESRDIEQARRLLDGAKLQRIASHLFLRGLRNIRRISCYALSSRVVVAGVWLLVLSLLLVFLLGGCFGDELFECHVIALFFWVTLGLGCCQFASRVHLLMIVVFATGKGKCRRGNYLLIDFSRNDKSLSTLQSLRHRHLLVIQNLVTDIP